MGGVWEIKTEKDSHLLTHSAGLCYLTISQHVQRYRKHTRNFKIATGATVEECCTQPLVYEPGTSWLYSTSIDWAGKLIERITGQTLEQYMKANIWQPLGIKDITFWPDQHPQMKSRMASMTIRDEETGKVIHDPDWQLPGGIDCFGGHGASASMPDYFKILRSILLDDEKVLKRSTTAQMFQPQLTKQSQEAQEQVMADPEKSAFFVGEFPTRVPLDWGIGGILTTEADEGWRGRNSLIWSGLPNLFWVRWWHVCNILPSRWYSHDGRYDVDLSTVYRPRSRPLRLVWRASSAAWRHEG